MMPESTISIFVNSTSGPTTFMQSSTGRDHDAGQRPAAEEQRGGDGGEGAGGGELADEEQQEAEARVLGHVAGDELGLGDRHVERRLGQLGLDGDQEDQEARRTGVRMYGLPMPSKPKISPSFCARHDALHVERAGLDDDADRRPGPSAARRRSAGRRPAGRRSASTCWPTPSRPSGCRSPRARRQAEDEEDAGLEVGEDRRRARTARPRRSGTTVSTHDERRERGRSAGRRRRG